jgi:hypothetical protein
VVGRLEALLALALDLREAFEHPDELGGGVLPPLAVERQRRAAEVRLGAGEAARGRRLVDQPPDRPEGRGDHRVLDDVGQRVPGLVGDVGPRNELVVVLDRPAPRRRAHEADQPERLQLADVVADVAERHAQLGRELARARALVFEETQDLHAQWVGERLDYSLV